MPGTLLWIWGLGALLVLVVAFFILRAERRRYVRSGRQGGWLAVRLATLPVAALAVAIPLGVSRQISGMEALAWFYILLFTAAPLVYFGLHVLVARLAGLSAGQGTALAAVGLVVLLLPAFAAVPLQQIGWSAQLAWSGFEAERAPDTPAAHALAGAQRLVLPGGEELWRQHWRADARVSALELVEVPPYGRSGAPGRHPFTSFGTWICRDRQDLHVTWPAAMGGVAMTLSWRDASGRLHRSQLRIAPPAGEPVPIAAQWSAQEVTLPVRPPRSAAVMAMSRTDGKVEYHRSLNMWEPHESPQDFCLPQPYRAGYALAGIALRIERGTGAAPLWSEFPRGAN